MEKSEEEKKENAELALEIKKMIVESLNLEDIKPEDIETNAPLFGDGLGLDSIDALELGIAMKKKFGVTSSPDTENVKQYFQSVAALMKFVEMQRAGKEESK